MRANALISQSSLQHNLSVVQKKSTKAKIVAIIKANGYGHQLDLITPLIKHCDMLGVSTLTEAVQLRKKTHNPILLLSGVYSSAELKLAITLKCHIVIHNTEQIKLINCSQQMVNIWIKIDTGMHRLGLSTEQYYQSLEKLQNNPQVNIICIMSHFSCADEVDNPINNTQLNAFNAITDNTIARSMANSAAILSQKNALFDFVRPGIMLYGVSPFGKVDTKLKPVMKFSAPIISIKTIQAGESVGYGATWTSSKKTKIAIIAVGYGDGYPRGAKNGTPVLIKNVLCPLVGRVSMDFICVDISTIKVKIGEMVVLWGSAQLRVETIAEYSNTIAYTLLTGISNRVNFSKTI